MRVLIVEDEPNLGQQLKSTLEGAGYAIDLATDGEEGHFLGSTESYDAIVLAVPHRELLAEGEGAVLRWAKDPCVVYDVKGALSFESVDGRL